MHIRRLVLLIALALVVLSLLSVPALAATTSFSKAIGPTWTKCTPALSHSRGMVTIRVAQKPEGTVYLRLLNSSGSQVGPLLTVTSPGTWTFTLGTAMFSLHAHIAGRTGLLAGSISY